MQPTALTAEHFRQYPPQARALAVQHLALLQQLPAAFLASLLQELIEYDYKFPAERAALTGELDYLQTVSAQQLDQLFREFRGIQLAAQGDKSNWVEQPLAFNEQFSAYLWSSHQMDRFQEAAAAYGEHLQAVVPAPAPVVPRLSIAVLGAGVSTYSGALFTRLRPHGTYFHNVQPSGGLAALVSGVSSRAAQHALPYAHWYIDGGSPVPTESAASSVTTVSYADLQPTRAALLDSIQRESSRPGAGPESLRNYLAHLRPEQLGMRGDPVLDRFQLKLLTEGSGTQIYSTTFAQWTAREALRRAVPLTVLVRFAPRQRQRPMSELLSNEGGPAELDPAGSLIDADMAAWYQWINLQRLSGHDQSVFLAWFEGHRQAVAIGPSLPRGTESGSPLTMDALLSLALTH